MANDDNEDTAGEEEQPANKKLRFTEPDLVVTVGSDDNKKDYHCYSQVLAMQSPYVDTMLSTSMVESQTMRITFPELTPEIWEDMFRFLNPSRNVTMTPQDALKLAALYDKYDFAAGREQCDQVLSDLFVELMPQGRYNSDKKPQDMDCLIEAFVLSDSANLVECKKLAIAYFRAIFLDEHTPFGGRLMLTTSHIRRLAPIIAKENHSGDFGYTTEEILQPNFAHYFVTNNKHDDQRDWLLKAVTNVRLFVAITTYAGKYKRSSRSNRFVRERMRHADGRRFDCGIGKGGGLGADWVIYQKQLNPGNNEEATTTILWKNPLSSNCCLPPKDGWVVVDNSVAGVNPQIDHGF